MKKVINAGIGGKSFTIDEDAYQRLDAYLNSFNKQTNMGFQSKEVMDEVEERIADLFSEALSSSHQDVVNLNMVEKMIAQIGLPDGSTEFFFDSSSDKSAQYYSEKAPKRFYRDPDAKKIGGVCSGLAAYFDIDVTIVRILAVVALLCGSAGFWAYIIFWIVAPIARTATEKCEMHGIPATAENIRRFSNRK